MTVHPPIDHHRKAAATHAVAAKAPRAAVVSHPTVTPKQVQKGALIGKTNLIERVAHQSGTSVKETSTIVNTTLETIREALTRGDRVQLTGFGSFGVRTRAAHKAVNPQTHARMQVPAKQHVRFSAGKGLSDAVAK